MLRPILLRAQLNQKVSQIVNSVCLIHHLSV
jgi:hypothetical protein